MAGLANRNQKPPSVPEAVDQDAAVSQQPPSWAARQGKGRAYVWLNREAKQELQILAIEKDKSVQALLVEAVNMMFEAYGRSPIAK